MIETKVEDLSKGWAQWRLGTVEEVVSEVVAEAEEVCLGLAEITCMGFAFISLIFRNA